MWFLLANSEISASTHIFLTEKMRQTWLAVVLSVRMRSSNAKNIEILHDNCFIWNEI